MGALNRAYDIEEGRPWWKVRLVAIGLTIGAAAFVLIALSLVLAGPTLAEVPGHVHRMGCCLRVDVAHPAVAVGLRARPTAVGLVYYFGPDADQDWEWITPGAVGATALWLVVSLIFKAYVANFTDYNAAYGAVGGVIVAVAVVLPLGRGDSGGRRTERGNRTRLPLRQTAGSEERGGQTSARTSCQASI